MKRSDLEAEEMLKVGWVPASTHRALEAERDKLLAELSKAQTEAGNLRQHLYHENKRFKAADAESDHYKKQAEKLAEALETIASTEAWTWTALSGRVASSEPLRKIARGALVAYRERQDKEKRPTPWGSG